MVRDVRRATVQGVPQEGEGEHECRHLPNPTEEEIEEYREEQEFKRPRVEFQDPQLQKLHQGTVQAIQEDENLLLRRAQEDDHLWGKYKSG